MGSLWLMLLLSVVFGGYAVSRLKTMKSKIGRALLYASIVSNGASIVVIAWVLALLHGRTA